MACTSAFKEERLETFAWSPCMGSAFHFHGLSQKPPQGLASERIPPTCSFSATSSAASRYLEALRPVLDSQLKEGDFLSLSHRSRLNEAAISGLADKSGAVLTTLLRIDLRHSRAGPGPPIASPMSL